MDFRKSKEELQEKKNSLKQEIIASDERARLMNENQSYNQMKNILESSTLSYLILFIIALVMMNLLDIKITNFSSFFRIITTITGSSICLGVTANKITHPKFKIKKQCKSFSNAKTEVEKLTEQIEYEIKREQANNKLKAVETAINLIDSNESNLEDIPGKQDNQEKKEQLTQQEVEHNIEILSAALKEKYSELDSLTTRNFLNYSFFYDKLIKDEKISAALASCLSGVALVMCIGLPLFVFNSTTASSSILLDLKTIILPFISGAAISCVYIIRKNNTQKKAVRCINRKLCHGSLSKYVNSEETMQKDQVLIQRIIDDISTIEIRLQKQKNILNHLITNNSQDNLCDVNKIDYQQESDLDTSIKNAKVLTKKLKIQ